jgi:P4 family phage/plasmid primase-like protien
VAALARGILLRDAAGFDAHPDLLNVSNGIVDLRTGELLPHDPDLLMTKLAPVTYKGTGYRHPDWNAALRAIPGELRKWYCIRMGQGITGRMTPDDLMIVQQGQGENGKSTVMAGIQAMAGDYFLLVSPRALLADASTHPTEPMDFRGIRLALLEETPEERRLSVTRLKMVVGTPQITARHMRKDSVTFDATHTLFLSTNYMPVIEETDHGTWRRIALVRFPFRWLKPGEKAAGKMDREGDPTLRERIKEGSDGQHSAILAWFVCGSAWWYGNDRMMPPLPAKVIKDTREWRSESDLVLGFIDDQLEFDGDCHVLASARAGAMSISSLMPVSPALMPVRMCCPTSTPSLSACGMTCARMASVKPVAIGTTVTPTDPMITPATGMLLRKCSQAAISVASPAPVLLAPQCRTRSSGTTGTQRRRLPGWGPVQAPSIGSGAGLCLRLSQQAQIMQPLARPGGIFLTGALGGAPGDPVAGQIMLPLVFLGSAPILSIPARPGVLVAVKHSPPCASASDFGLTFAERRGQQPLFCALSFRVGRGHADSPRRTVPYG